MLTHQDYGGYSGTDDYDDAGPWDDDPADEGEAAHAQDDGNRAGKAALTTKQRKRKRWRIVRRTLYALFGIFFVLPALAFTIAYFLVDVPSPEQVAAGQGQVITYYYSDGSEMAKVAPPGGGNRVILEPHQIPELMKHAAYAAEDASFETNPGFDISGIARAAWSQITGGGGGGSTISQQYVKQATGYDDHSYVRKFVEVVKAFKMNNEQSKTEIITAYLNTIYLGRGAYGVQTASQAYFGKDVGKLDPSQAALLAGMIQNPSNFDDMEYMKQRWSYVLDQMVANGWLSAQERQKAKFPELIPESKADNTGIPPDLVHLRNRVDAELAAKGYPEKKLQSGGYKVYTTIDPRAQKLAKQAVTSVMEGQPKKLREAFVATDPNSGAVRAYYGGSNPEGRDWANTLRNPGSSFKPFDLVALLKSGQGLAKTYNGTSPQEIAGATRHNAGEGASCSVNCTVARAMEVSANTVFFNMMVNDLSPAQVIDAAHSAGIPLKWNGEKTLAENVNIAIGAEGAKVTPTMLANAYATFANGGMRHETHFVAKLVSSDGDLVYKTNTEGKPAFAPQNPELNKKIAGNVTESLEPVLPHSSLSCQYGYDCAGKTGTHEYTPEGGGISSQNSQAWMVGYSPAISASAWVGTGYNRPIQDSAGRPIYGSDLPGAIWQTFMRSYLEGTPKLQFPEVEAIGQPLHQYEPVDRDPDPQTRREDADEGDESNDTTTQTTTTRPEPPEDTQGETTTPRRPTDTGEPDPGDGDGGDLFDPSQPGGPPENQ